MVLVLAAGAPSTTPSSSPGTFSMRSEASRTISFTSMSSAASSVSVALPSPGVRCWPDLPLRSQAKELPVSPTLSRKDSTRSWAFSFDDQRGILPQRPARLPPRTTPPSHRRNSSTISRHELHRDSKSTLRGQPSISQLVIPTGPPQRPRSAPSSPFPPPFLPSPALPSPLPSPLPPTSPPGSPNRPSFDRSKSSSTIRIVRLRRKASTRLREAFGGSVGVPHGDTTRSISNQGLSILSQSDLESSSPERDLPVDASRSTSSTARSLKTRPTLVSVDFAPSLQPSFAPLDPATPSFSTSSDSSSSYLTEAVKSSKVQGLRKKPRTEMDGDQGEKNSTKGFVGRLLRLRRSTPSLSLRAERLSTPPPPLPPLPPPLSPAKHLHPPPFAPNHSAGVDIARLSDAEATAREVSVALLSQSWERDIATYSLRNLSSTDSLPLGSPGHSSPFRERNPSVASSSSRRSSNAGSSQSGHELVSPTYSTASNTFGGPIASFYELKRSLPAARAPSSTTSLPRTNRPSPQYLTPLSPPPRRPARSGSRPPPPPPLIFTIPPSRPSAGRARSNPTSPTSRTAPPSAQDGRLDGYASRRTPEAILRATSISPALSAVFGASLSHASPRSSSPTPSSRSHSTSSSNSSR